MFWLCPGEKHRGYSQGGFNPNPKPQQNCFFPTIHCNLVPISCCNPQYFSIIIMKKLQGIQNCNNHHRDLKEMLMVANFRRNADVLTYRASDWDLYWNFALRSVPGKFSSNYLLLVMTVSTTSQSDALHSPNAWMYAVIHATNSVLLQNNNVRSRQSFASQLLWQRHNAIDFELICGMFWERDLCFELNVTDHGFARCGCPKTDTNTTKELPRNIQ